MLKYSCYSSCPLVIPSYCNKEVYNKENLFNSLNYDVAAKKRKKDMLNSKTKTQCKPFVLNLRRKLLEDHCDWFFEGEKKKITPHMFGICFNVDGVIDRGYWDLCMQKPGCAFYE